MDKIQSLISTEKYVLVDFYAEWCDPCKILDEILKKVTSRIGSKMKVLKIDVDESKNLAASFNVLSVPVLIFFKDGNPVWRMNGFLTAPEMEKTLGEFFDV